MARMTWKLKEQHSQPPALPESPWAEKIYHRRQVWRMKIVGFWWLIFIPGFLWWIFIWKKMGWWKKRIGNMLFFVKEIQSTSWYDMTSFFPSSTNSAALSLCYTSSTSSIIIRPPARLQKPVGDSPSASSTTFYHQDGTDRRGPKLFQPLFSSQEVVTSKHYIVWKPWRNNIT